MSVDELVAAAASQAVQPVYAQTETEGDSLTVYLYDEIGNGVRAIDLVPMIARSRRVRLRINSLGGDMFDSIAIYNALREHPRVTARVDGIAASAAAIILQGARLREIVAQGRIFVHRPWASVAGNADLMDQAREMLESFEADVERILSERTGQDIETVRGWLRGRVDGTMFTAAQAREVGLVDVVVSGGQEARGELSVPQGGYVPADPPGGEGEGVEGEWERPNLSDFTDKRFDELSVDERRAIAAHFAWVESLETYGDLHLPHHYPPNHPQAHKPSLNGVRNALARLPLLQGPTEAERERIRQHLRKHLPARDRLELDRVMLMKRLLDLVATEGMAWTNSRS